MFQGFKVSGMQSCLESFQSFKVAIFEIDTLVGLRLMFLETLKP